MHSKSYLPYTPQNADAHSPKGPQAYHIHLTNFHRCLIVTGSCCRERVHGLLQRPCRNLNDGKQALLLIGITIAESLFQLLMFLKKFSDELLKDSLQQWDFLAQIINRFPRKQADTKELAPCPRHQSWTQSFQKSLIKECSLNPVYRDSSCGLANLPSLRGLRRSEQDRTGSRHSDLFLPVWSAPTADDGILHDCRYPDLISYGSIFTYIYIRSRRNFTIKTSTRRLNGSFQQRVLKLRHQPQRHVEAAFEGCSCRIYSPHSCIGLKP